MVIKLKHPIIYFRFEFSPFSLTMAPFHPLHLSPHCLPLSIVFFLGQNPLSIMSMRFIGLKQEALNVVKIKNPIEKVCMEINIQTEELI